MDFESLTHDIFDHVTVETFSMKAVTEWVIKEYLPQFQKGEQTVELKPPKDASMSMDKSMYIQILHNIFSNAIKYAGTGAKILITYEKSDTEYTLIFADNGRGIPEKEMAFVKEKFYRVDKARTGQDKSMGIGLSIIDRIARLHRGTLSIEKNSPKGVKVIVKIGR